jgi:hypothetical protein
MWNSTAPTTSVFSLGTNAQVNTNTASYIAYLFAEKAGFSKFGTYTGNGSADGPFVYTGFKPKYIMIKNIDDLTPFGTADWVVIDTARDTTNPISARLFPSTAGTEDTSDNFLDSNANGFKIRTADGTDGMMNVSGDRYVYAAFAYYPFERATTEQTLAVASSTRFNGSNTYLSRTPGSTGNLTTWTFSAWYKDVKPTTGQRTFISSQGNFANEHTSIMINSDNGDDTIFVTGIWVGGINVIRASTQARHRDPSVWKHLVVSVDTTQAASADRVKVWINNELQTLTGTIPAQNENRLFLNGTFLTSVGRFNSTNFQHSYFNGLMSEVNLIDGTTLSPTDFGQADSNGNWGPKTYAGVYGTNGFHLDFANNADIGNDISGNNNDFTNNNLATTDVLYDSPTHNFAIGNPIHVNSSTISKGGLSYTIPFVTTSVIKGTIAVSSGKWYWEVKDPNTSGGIWGVMPVDGTTNYWPGASSGYGLSNVNSALGNVYFNTAVVQPTYTTVHSAGDVHGIALDLDNHKIFFSTNGSWLYSSNPVTGANPAVSGVATGTWVPAFGNSNAGAITYEANFGQGGLAGATYDSGSDGYFVHAAPTGYKALSSKNLIAAGASSIAKPNSYFDTFIYTGNGTSQTFSTLAFSPGFVWVKGRSVAQNNALWGDGTLGATTNPVNGWWSEF